MRLQISSDVLSRTCAASTLTCPPFFIDDCWRKCSGKRNLRRKYNLSVKQLPDQILRNRAPSDFHVAFLTIDISYPCSYQLISHFCIQHNINYHQYIQEKCEAVISLWWFFDKTPLISVCCDIFCGFWAWVSYVSSDSATGKKSSHLLDFDS